MKILMVNPRGFYFSEGAAAYKRISYPMGLMQLSSAVKKIKIQENGEWQTLAEDREDRSVTLIDAAAEGFGDEDGTSDREEIRNHKKIKIFGLSDEEIIEKVREIQPDVIFITGQFTKQLDEFYVISRLLKNNFPGAVIVGGGIAVSDLYKKMPFDPTKADEYADQMEKSTFEPFQNGLDIVVAGEGEISTSLLLDRLETASFRENREVFKDIPNLRFVNADETIYNSEKAGISEDELNRLPFPDLKIINKDLYSAKRAHFGEAKSDRWIELFTSRGCSRNCRFCATKPFFGCYRKLTDQRVNELLKYYLDNGFDEVCLEDDSILDDPARAIRIFQLIKSCQNDEGKSFNQFTGIGGIEFKHLLIKTNGEVLYEDKSETLGKWLISEDEYENLNSEQKENCVRLVDGEEIIRAMASDLDPVSRESKENGCYRIYLAMESANQKTLEHIGKTRDIPELYRRAESEAIELLNQAGIETHGGMMIGNPATEGLPEIMNDIRFCREMMEHGLARTAIFPYIMLPGSNMSLDDNAMNQYARIRNEFGYLSYGFDTTNMDSLKYGWTAEELVTISVWANAALDSGRGRNWQAGDKDSLISADRLDLQIDYLLSGDHLYEETIKRLRAEGGDELVEIYLEARHVINGGFKSETEEGYYEGGNLGLSY